jgi:hypothetical protein
VTQGNQGPVTQKKMMAPSIRSAVRGRTVVIIASEAAGPGEMARNRLGAADRVPSEGR